MKRLLAGLVLVWPVLSVGNASLATVWGASQLQEQLKGRDVAYVVQKEIIRFRVPDQTTQVTQELRAVMVFRFESGAWRISHRQADSQTTKQTER